MAASDLAEGRSNQKTRTRIALLDAAQRLLDGGDDPTLEQVAESALVSRATAYRYFSSIEELLAEASITGSNLGTPHDVLSTLGPEAELADRIEHVARHLARQLVANPRATHLMMRSIYGQWLTEPETRPGRRMEFLDAALDGHTDGLDARERKRLLDGLALVSGAEAVISALDVCGLDADEAVDTIGWAARSLVNQALAES